MHNAVIFDFDGVIIDSLELQRKAFHEGFRSISDEPFPSFEEYIRHSGDSLRNIFDKMNLPLCLIEPYQRISATHLELIELKGGILDVLSEIRESGWKCGLNTGKDRRRTLEIVEYLRLNDRFDAIVCSDDIDYPKPHPESLQRIVRQLGVTVDTSVFVGDGRNDILCAKRAEVQSIAVAWGHSSLEDLLKEEPDHAVREMRELMPCIRSVFAS